MKNGRWGWAGYDIDDPDGADYCHQTDVHANGMVHDYSAIDGDFANGHTHGVSRDMDSHCRGERISRRGVNDPKSRTSTWKDRH